MVTLKIELDEDSSLELATLCKRLNYTDFLSKSDWWDNKEQAYAMQHAIGLLKESLEKEWYTQR